MTKEDELKKQAETEYRKQEERCKHSWNGAVFQFGYLAGAEPREKRITDLEAQIEKMKSCENCKYGFCSWSSASIDKNGRKTVHAWNEEKQAYCDIGNSNDAKYQCWEIKEND